MKKALIVDDEENARLYLAKMLAVSFPDMMVQFAGSPSEALFLLEKSRADILFLDVEMPGKSGLEMLQELREAHSALPVIVVSAYSKVEFVKKALRLNVVDYLDKPVNPDELETAVNKAICCNEDPKTIKEDDNKLCIPTDKGTMYIEQERLLYFAANGRSATIYFFDEEEKETVRENLIGLEKILPPGMFKRVSRQYIVNTKYIQLVSKNKFIVLQTAKGQVKLSKIYPHIIEELAK